VELCRGIAPLRACADIADNDGYRAL